MGSLTYSFSVFASETASSMDLVRQLYAKAGTEVDHTSPTYTIPCSIPDSTDARTRISNTISSLGYSFDPLEYQVGNTYTTNMCS